MISELFKKICSHGAQFNVKFIFVRSSTETLDERDFGGNDDNVPGSQEQGASSRREPAEVTWAWRGCAEDSTTRRLGESEEQISEAYEEDVIEDFDDDG